ncbi:MAG: futalosine hydrolase [Flavisolibacter sp.]
MHLLLCAATPFEIQPITDFIKRESLANVEVLITGIGLMAATYSITEAVLRKRPQFILQAGVAGSLDESLPLTKIVLVENEIAGDVGVVQQGRFHSIFDLGLLGKNDSPWKEGKLSNNVTALKEVGLTIVDGVTVNEISTDEDRINYYRKLGARIESMEGAALHYVALQEKIPFLQIRSLSNFAGERDKGKWMMKEAINSLNIEMERVLTKFLRS